MYAFYNDIEKMGAVEFSNDLHKWNFLTPEEYGDSCCCWFRDLGECVGKIEILAYNDSVFEICEYSNGYGFLYNQFEDSFYNAVWAAYEFIDELEELAEMKIRNRWYDNRGRC